MVSSRWSLGASSRRPLLAAILVILAGRSVFADGLTIVPADASIKTAGGKLAGQEGQEGGWNLWSNGEVGDMVNFAADGKYKVVVRAGGTPAKGAGPAMAILVAGRPAGRDRHGEHQGIRRLRLRRQHCGRHTPLHRRIPQ